MKSDVMSIVAIMIFVALVAFGARNYLEKKDSEDSKEVTVIILHPFTTASSTGL